MNTIENRVQVLSQFDRNIKFNLIKIVGEELIAPQSPSHPTTLRKINDPLQIQI